MTIIDLTEKEIEILDDFDEALYDQFQFITQDTVLIDIKQVLLTKATALAEEAYKHNCYEVGQWLDRVVDKIKEELTMDRTWKDWEALMYLFRDASIEYFEYPPGVGGTDD